MTMFIMIPRSAPCTAKRMNQARAPADTAIQQYKCIHPVVLCVENEERQAATHDQWGWHIYASGYNVARHSCSHERPSQPHIRWNSSTGCSRSFYCYVLLNTQNSFYHRARENTQHRTHSAHTHTHSTRWTRLYWAVVGISGHKCEDNVDEQHFQLCTGEWIPSVSLYF